MATASNVNIKIEDNSDKVKSEMEAAIHRALTMIGITAENYAVDNIRATVKNATGTLANSMDSKVDGDTVTVGTNLHYAVYNELGTGIYGENSTGGWWVYVAGKESQSSHAKGKRYTEAEARKVVAILRSKGLDAHMTQGMKPKHFLKKACEEHVEQYKQIAEDELKKG